VTYHIEWRFSDTQSSKEGSWSENWYGDAASAAQVLASYAAPIDVRKRLSILSPDYSLRYVQVRNLFNRFDSAKVSFPGDLGAGTFAPPGTDESEGEQPWDRLQVKVTAVGNTGGGHPVPFTTVRQFALGGLPEGVLVDTTNFAGKNGWLNLFNAWVANFLQPPFNQVRHVFPGTTLTSLPAAFLGGDLRSISLNFLAAQDPAWSVGQIVRIAGSVNTVGFNKLWRVKQVQPLTAPASTTYYMFPGRSPVVGNLALPWSVTPITYLYANVTAMAAVQGMARKVGRFPDAYRGRARARAR
jgi:hypothetical protein